MIIYRIITMMMIKTTISTFPPLGLPFVFGSQLIILSLTHCNETKKTNLQRRVVVPESWVTDTDSSLGKY